MQLGTDTNAVRFSAIAMPAPNRYFRYNWLTHSRLELIVIAMVSSPVVFTYMTVTSFKYKSTQQRLYA